MAQISNHKPPRQFLCEKMLLTRKKLASKMLIEQIIEFESRGLGPPSRTCTPKPVIFMTKQKSPKQILE